MSPTIYFIFGGIIIFVTVIAMLDTSGVKHDRVAPLLAAQPAHVPAPTPTINYAANPYRTGAYVYVMESSAPSQQDWTGTYMGMSDGYALIRDQETNVVAHVNKDQVFGAKL